jgi:hypothetical protein
VETIAAVESFTDLPADAKKSKGHAFFQKHLAMRAIEHHA